jgi:hypothetical protein
MRLRGRLLVLLATRETGRAARARRASLERQLSCYATPAERRDLLATLDQYPDQVTHELRDILTRTPAPRGNGPMGNWPMGNGPRGRS